MDGEDAAAVDEVAEATPEEAAPEQSAGDEGLEAPFAIDEVPVEYRDHVERLDKGYKARFTQKSQELAQMRAEAEAALELQRRLNSEDEDEALAALNELAAKRGFEGTVEDDPQVGPEDQLPPEVVEAIETTKKLQADREAEKKTQRVEVMRAHVQDGLDPWRDDAGRVDETRERLATFAALPQLDQHGLPDIAAAVELVEAVEAAAVQRFIASRTGATPAPDLSGGSGVPQADTSTERGRMDAALAIASRHLGSN